jgi:hypothetical protein
MKPPHYEKDQYRLANWLCHYSTTHLQARVVLHELGAEVL